MPSTVPIACYSQCNRGELARHPQHSRTWIGLCTTSWDKTTMIFVTTLLVFLIKEQEFRPQHSGKCLQPAFTTHRLIAATHQNLKSCTSSPTGDRHITSKETTLCCSDQHGSQKPNQLSNMKIPFTTIFYVGEILQCCNPLSLLFVTPSK